MSRRCISSSHPTTIYNSNIYLHVPSFALFLGLTIPFIDRNFGDVVDSSFNCPAVTTCPIVCVPTLQDCPPSLNCQLNTKLCLDGTCHRDCFDADASFDPLAKPYPFQCAPIALWSMFTQICTLLQRLQHVWCLGITTNDTCLYFTGTLFCTILYSDWGDNHIDVCVVCFQSKTILCTWIDPTSLARNTWWCYYY